MEISYKTKGIYSVLEAQLGNVYNLDCEKYKFKMIQDNNIKGLLKPEYYEIDEAVFLDYNVSSVYLLSRMLQMKRPDGEILQQIMSCLCNAILNQKAYLLNPHDIVFLSEYIFYDSSKEEMVFINIPGYNHNLREQIKEFLENIMKIFNHKDRPGLEYMYGLYDIVASEHFDISIFQKYVNSKIKSEYKKNPIQENSINKGEELLNNHKLIPLCNGELGNIEFDTYVNQIIVGREQSEANYTIASHQISRVHASLYQRDNKLLVKDENSTNGTFVNSRKIEALKEVLIKKGDIVAFANEEFYVS